MITNLRRIFKAGWINFSRNGGLALTTCFIMIMTVSLVTSLFLLKEVSQFLISSLQEKVDISVYFKDGSLEEDILSIEAKLSEIPEVKDVKYVSKDEALEDFIQRHKDDPVLMESLEEVGGNPLLASLNIKAFQAQQYGAIVDFLDNGLPSSEKDLIEKIDYHQRKPVIEKIFAITSGISKGGISLSIVLAILAILVAFNTIRLAILNQKEELTIQRLVGASNWFIRGPFLIQGAIVGVFATVICLLIFTLICWIFSSKLEVLFPGLNIFSYFIGNFWIILLIQLATGIGLGVVSSIIATRRYLKV
jgi:cell division transport system permease protein